MTEPRLWSIIVTPRAEAELKRLPARDQARIRPALDSLAPGSQPGDVQKLSGRQDQWRLRVGDYRVLFTRDDVGRRIVVLHVPPRGRAHRD